MMKSLFSMFDPSSSSLNTSWALYAMFTIILSMNMWKVTSNPKKVVMKILTEMKKETKFALGKSEKSMTTTMVTFMMVILLLNSLAIFPQVFSVTSHLTFNLPLSLTVWLMTMTFGYFKNTKQMIYHLLPQGSPIALMSFMVVIEMTSNMIRPITLCVRLTANLIAGHVLMSLLGNLMCQMSTLMNFVSFMVPTALTVLETAVSFIQAYVFMTLLTLYNVELK